ncbi:MAG: hypothetical protein MMC33_001967 [Icmadophila ericetorum]|nr:hypothetical protein [Icmadophila ericetorum]
MSFLRTRLSRVWARSEVAQDPSKPAESAPSSVNADELPPYGDAVRVNQEVSPETTHEAHDVEARSEVNQSPRRRTLHKAASITFKMLSDTLRSKATLFYADPPEPTSPSPVEQETSPKKEYRRSMIASFGRRNSTTELPFPDISRVPSLPHELDVTLPISCLVGRGIDGTEDPQAQDDSIQPCRADSSYSGSTLTPENPGFEPAFTKDIIRPVVDEKSDLTYEIASACPVPAIDTALSSTGVGPKRGSVDGSLFVKGNDYRRSIGTSSPFRKILQDSRSSKEFSPSELHKLSEYPKPVQDTFRPLLHRTTSLPHGLSNLRVLNGGDPLEKLSIYDKPQASSYSSDSESDSDISETPSMGSRAAWDRGRADRARRYQAVHAMTAETESDTDNETKRLELQHCWAEYLVDESVAPEYLIVTPSASTPGSPKKVHFADICRPSRQLSDTTEKGHVTEPQVPHISPATSAITAPRPQADLHQEISSLGDTSNETTEHLFYRSVEDLKIDFTPSEGSATFEITTERNASAKQLADNNTEKDHNRKTVESLVLERGDENAGDCTKYKRIRMRPFTQRKHARTAFEDPAIKKWSQNAMSDADTIEEDQSDAAPYIQLIDLEDSSTVEPNHIRSSSSQSMSTSNSCAVTTHSPECFSPLPKETLHVRSTPVRRTSSLNAEIHAALEQGNVAETQTNSDTQEDLLLQPLIFKRDVTHRDSIGTLPSFSPGADTPYTSRSAYQPPSPTSTLYFPSSECTIHELLHEFPFGRNKWSLTPRIDDTSDDGGVFITPLQSPKRKAYLSDAANSHGGMGTELRQSQGIERGFVAARLPLFGPAKREDDNVASSALDSHTVAARQSVADQQLHSHLANIGLGSMARSVSGSSTESSHFRHGRKRCWKMKEITLNGEEFIYDSVGTPSRTLQTSSLKKGVWWKRDSKILADVESPLTGKTGYVHMVDMRVDLNLPSYIKDGFLMNIEPPSDTDTSLSLQISIDNNSGNADHTASPISYEHSTVGVTSLNNTDREALEMELRKSCEEFEETEVEPNSSKVNELAPKMEDLPFSQSSQDASRTGFKSNRFYDCSISHHSDQVHADTNSNHSGQIQEDTNSRVDQIKAGLDCPQLYQSEAETGHSQSDQTDDVTDSLARAIAKILAKEKIPQAEAKGALESSEGEEVLSNGLTEVFMESQV